MLDTIAQIWASSGWPISFSGEVMILTILAVFAALLVYETLHPRDKHPSKNLHQSYKTNIGMFAVNTITLSVLSTSSFLSMIEPNSYTGLFNFISDNKIKIVISFLSLDWFLYQWHKTCHKYDWLWMFHRVHHNDNHLNVSTAFRVHFMELFLTNVLKVMFVIITGIDGMVLLFHELVTTIFVMFHHTNIKVKYEPLFSKVFIGPLLHRTHHSVHRFEHDSNYGAIFSIWDRIFGTLLAANPVSTGINGYSPQSLINVIRFGFTTPVIPVREPVTPLTEMIQVAAYYRAEKRGFIHGNDQYDWYLAEQEIHKMVYKPAEKSQPKSKFSWSLFNNNHLSLC